MKTGAAVLGMIVTGAIGFAVGMSVKSTQTANVTVREGEGAAKVAEGAKPAAGAAQPATDVFKVPVGEAATKGPRDALITIVEFSDFECPFCGRVLPTLDQIQKEYGNKVRIAFKHNPLPFHKAAEPAAEWAIAAHDQGKFWEMHDKLFENRANLQPDALERYASELGIDVAKAKSYIASGKPKEIIRQDQALANKIGARGTPAFFINGVSLSGAQPVANFKAVIDAQLEKAEKMVASGTSKEKLYDTIIAQGRETAPPPQQQQQQQQPPATRQKVTLVEGTPTKGSKQPLVTIVEWSDFECPFCSRANPTIEQILKTYGDKVQIQFRHQPLSFHPRAMPAAKAAAAAQRQGKFWEMHDKMFANAKALGDADLEKYAQEIGLDVKKWKADMESPQVNQQIQRDIADGNSYGARGTPSFFVNGVPVRGALPFDSFKTVIDKEIELAEKLMKEGVKRQDVYGEILTREAGKAVAGAAPPTPSAPPAPAGPVNINLGKAPIKGDKNAPIQIVVWSDFQCPFCGRVNPTIAKLEETYGKKVAVAFKHYPLPFHQQAEIAAIASLAAHKQGKFWPMHDKLFANQQALHRESLVGYAKELGLNVDQFQKDLDDPSLKAWVQSDLAEGSKNGVNGTPATFINGRLVSGAQPYEAFQAIVEEELKKKPS